LKLITPPPPPLYLSETIAEDPLCENLQQSPILLFQRLSRGAYWQAVLRDGLRYALDGTPCGEVTAQEQAYTQQALAQREAYRAARGSPRSANTQ
jgi:sRNA-binding protein